MFWESMLQKNATTMIGVAKKYGVDAQVIGRVEANDKKSLLIKTGTDSVDY